MTLKEVAEQAGVSTATVSNVVNGNYHKVSEETRQKVETIIRRTGYKPNVMARSLANNKSRIIGLVVPHVAKNEDYMTNPYYAHMIAALEKYVRGRDYYLMLRCVENGQEILPILASWNVDGAFFLGVFHTEVQKILEGIDVPIVFLDTYAQGESIVNVGIDDYRGGYLSARYLIGKGHRRIALVSPEYTQEGVIRERYQGFTDACRELSVDFTEKDVYLLKDTRRQSAMQVGQDLVFSEEGYTAVATMSDVAALGVVEGMRQFGVRVPDDISVIGFDNLPEGDFMTPRLTTIEQDFQRKAERAAELLLQMIEEDIRLEVNEKQPLRVRERQSVKEIRE